MRSLRVFGVPFLMFVITFVMPACNGAKGPSNPLTGPSITGSSGSGDQFADNNDVHAEGESGGVTITPFYDTFGNPCTPKAPGSVLQRNITAKNHSGYNLKSHPTIQHGKTPGCAVDASELTNVPPNQVPQYLQVSVTSLANNQTSQIHFTFALPSNACGVYLVKDFWKPTGAKLLNKVVDTGIVCAPPPSPFCEQASLNLNIEQYGSFGRVVHVTPTFNGDGTVDVDWGDGKYDNGLSKGVRFPSNNEGHNYPNVDASYLIKGTASITLNYKTKTCHYQQIIDTYYGYPQ